MQCVYVYICMYTLRSILMWKQDISVSKWEANINIILHAFFFFLTEKCQMLHVVKLWATWWVGFGWVERCLSSTEPCFLLKPGPSTPLAPAFEMDHGQQARGVSCLASAYLGWLAQSRFKLQLLKCIHSLSWESNIPVQDGFRLYFILMPPSSIAHFKWHQLSALLQSQAWHPCPSSSFPEGTGTSWEETLSSGSEEHHQWKREWNKHFGCFQSGCVAAGGRRELWRWGGTHSRTRGKDICSQGGGQHQLHADI